MAQTGLRTKAALLLAKEESSYGSDPTPTADDNAIVVISDLVVAPAGEIFMRSPFDITLSPRAPVVGGSWYEISFITELHASGTNTTAPRIGDLFEACGMSEAVGGSSVIYTPATTSLKSCTIYVYFDGLQHQFHGCVGTFRILLISGDTAKIEWRFFGKYEAPTDVALPTSVTYDSPTPPSIVSASFLFDDVSFEVQQLEIDLGAVVARRPSLNESTGIKGFTTVGREPRGSFNPESVLVATYNIWTIWRASTRKAISVNVGSTSGNKWTISLPKVTLDTPAYGDREGIRTFELPFVISRNSGDDEISLSHV